MKPDSRRHLIYRPNEALYYAYVNTANNNFGIAKIQSPFRSTPTAVITINTDNNQNHAGIDFDITGSTLTGAVTFISGAKSQILTFKKAL